MPIYEELRYRKADGGKECADILLAIRNEEGRLNYTKHGFAVRVCVQFGNWRKSLKHSNQVIFKLCEAIKATLKDACFGR